MDKKKKKIHGHCIKPTVWLLSPALQWFCFSLWVSGFHFILPNTSWIPRVLFLLDLLTFCSCSFIPFCYPYPSVSCSRKWDEIECTLKKSQQQYQVAALLSSHCSFHRQHPQLCFVNFDGKSISNGITEKHLITFPSVPHPTMGRYSVCLIEINETTFSAEE